MADVNIPDLPAAAALTGAELLEAFQGAGNVKVLLSAILAAASSAGRHAAFVPAGGMSPSKIGGCAPLAIVASGSNLPDIETLDFDPTTQEYAQFRLRMPKSWDESSTITFVPVWRHGAATTNFGVTFSLQAVALSNNDPFGTAFGTAVTSSHTGGTADHCYSGPESAAMTVAGTPAAEDLVAFRFSRVVGDAGDTLAVDACLVGITLYINTNASNDA